MPRDNTAWLISLLRHESWKNKLQNSSYLMRVFPSPYFSPVDTMIAQDFLCQRVPEPAPYLIRGPKA